MERKIEKNIEKQIVKGEKIEANSFDSSANAIVNERESVKEDEKEYLTNEYLATHAINDQISTVDKLGFTDYTDAFVGMITSPDTKPPLTIGIYGPWGAGKSTFMAMMRRKLEHQKFKKPNLIKRIVKLLPLNKKELPSKAPELQTIWFNAWLYSKEKKLWTAFMKKIFEKIEEDLSLMNKVNFSYQLYRNNLKSTKIILVVLLFVSFFAIIAYLLSGNSVGFGSLGGFVGLVLSTLPFYNQIQKPITTGMLSLIEKKETKEEVGLMSKFRDDIDFLNKFFENNKPHSKIIIFVDDLDRCPDDSSVEILESVSLLLNIDYFIIIFGVDEQIIRNAIKLRYKGLFDETNVFLDKIVQIPFHISEPTEFELMNYVSSLIGPEEVKTIEMESPTTISISLKESEDEQEQFIRNIEYLPKNPRKVKQLINIYRLVKILASNVREAELIDNNYSKLIKWLIICNQWPFFVKKINLKFKSKETSLLDILTSAKEECKIYLFSTDGSNDIDSGVLEESLNKGVISEGLKKRFNVNGFSLSENATIRKERNDKWKIINEKNLYVAEKEDKMLNFYETSIKNQEQIKKIEEFINKEPILEMEDIENFIPFTINFLHNY